ncbi:NAD-dependent epimerase/dehydratase family protein [Streptococcus sp. NLN76]|uniref:NAD-dependent epimerase/dehydratase family protein n=1 Tax=Streptococcus sp. NLN76 TaxID=2822800 RepID=UPI0018AAC001|nr:NAD-dependent epimerase/dehydratase family protein [Streptococcus sp. NLN76]MBF8969890.1 NAD-dependent epimerase/dehydratase family protein [Streptococcus sp. NLN76]
MNLDFISNNVLEEDFKEIADSNFPFNKFREKNFFISGSTGLVGSNLVKSLVYLNRYHDLNLKIYLHARNFKKINEIYGDLSKYPEMKVVLGDITSPYNSYISSNLQIDYIFHAASVTTSQMMVNNPVDTIKVSLEGTMQMLELAKDKQVESFVYLSSMEVYGEFKNKETVYVSEDMLGFINPLSLRSNYPESKRMCENLCVAYNSQYGVPTKIARLSQTFGAGILPGENRVFAQFARSVLNQEDIILHTEGKSEGNYCYLSDCIRALYLILSDGENATAYNVSNEANHISIASMAKLVAEELSNNSIKVVFDIPETNLYGYAVPSRFKLNTERLLNLGWKPKYDLVTSYKRMIKSMELSSNDGDS